MSELISIHLGTTGIELGNTYWNSLLSDYKSQNPISQPGPNYHRVLKENPSGLVNPRALFLDTEDISIDSLLKSANHNSFQALTTSFDVDSGNIYSNVKYTLSCGIMNEIDESLRKQVETCDSLNGFLVYLGTGGGTGPGLATRIYYNIMDDYQKIDIGSILVYPCCEMGEVNVEPYNSCFAISDALRQCSFALPFDNLALYNKQKSLGIQNPTFKDCNRIISKCLLNFTSPLISDSISFKDYISFFSPNSQFNFISPSIADTSLNEDSDTDWKGLLGSVINSKSNLLRESSSESNIEKGLFVQRGQSFFEIEEGQINLNRENFKQLKYTSFERELGLYSISNNVLGVLKNLIYEYDSMYNKRAFINWFVLHGMESEEFPEARDELENLLKRYSGFPIIKDLLDYC